jgi:hypothetical protein
MNEDQRPPQLPGRSDGPATRMLRPARARVEKARSRGGECAEGYQLVEMVRPHDELADVVVGVLR